MELAPDWNVSDDVELIDLDGKDVVVPDMALLSRTDNWFILRCYGAGGAPLWRSRWSRLQKQGPDRLILAVSSAHAAKLPSLNGAVHVFKYAECAVDNEACT